MPGLFSRLSDSVPLGRGSGNLYFFGGKFPIRNLYFLRGATSETTEKDPQLRVVVRSLSGACLIDMWTFSKYLGPTPSTPMESVTPVVSQVLPTVPNTRMCSSMETPSMSPNPPLPQGLGLEPQPSTCDVHALQSPEGGQHPPGELRSMAARGPMGSCSAWPLTVTPRCWSRSEKERCAGCN